MNGLRQITDYRPSSNVNIGLSNHHPISFACLFIYFISPRLELVLHEIEITTAVILKAFHKR